jgi:cyanophycinase
MRLLTSMGLFLCCASLPLSADDARHGHLVLNGGGSKPDVVMEKFIELAGGRAARIVVFPTASEEADTGQYYQRLFLEYGCKHVYVADVRSRKQADDRELAQKVAAMDGIWFSGGDQRRVTKVLRATALGAAVEEAFARGAVIGGTSAGTACQSELMITGDGDFTVIGAENVELWDGLGLFEGVIVDQHFVARSRHNRLISAVLEHPELLGVGVDEATAVWVKPNGTFEVLGDGWVIVYDASQASITRAKMNRLAKPLGGHGLVTHVLLPGDIFDVNERAVMKKTDRDRP